MATRAAGKAAAAAGKTASKTAGTASKTASKTASEAASTASDTASKAAPTGELSAALRKLGTAAAGRAASSLTDKISATSGRLTDYADGGGGGGLLGAITGGGGRGGGIKGKAAMGAVKGGLSGVMDKVKNAFGGGGGGGGDKIKVTNIVEHLDIGAPIDLVYDAWTRFSEFPRFMKKVENVDQTSDEKLTWKAQIFWSHRTWEATILDQVPDDRIVWQSKGAKGHVDGAVTFHELAPNLTRVVLVLEYHPQGFFERTGNIWRAQGRRARLEFKHFARYVMTEALLHPDEIEGWRGEIHDGEVVEPDDESEDEPDDTDSDDSDDYDDSDEDDEDEEPEEDEESDDELDDEPDDEEEPEEPPRRRRSRAGTRRSR